MSGQFAEDLHCFDDDSSINRYVMAVIDFRQSVSNEYVCSMHLLCESNGVVLESIVYRVKPDRLMVC